MIYQEDEEMSDVEIRLKYGAVIDEAITAFSVDANYAADVVKKAKGVLARRAKRSLPA